MEAEYPIFKGTVEKIIIESDDSGYEPPDPGQEIHQRLTMRRNGNVTLTRYFSGDFSKVPPTKDFKTMKRYRSKPTEKLMDYIAFRFNQPYVHVPVCDGGVWGMEMTNSEGKKFSYIGSLSGDMIIGGLNISQVARRVLEMDELWMFDGGMREDTLE